MVRAECLRKIGGYRSKFTASEDKDLCWRLGEIGRLERLPEVLVDYRYHRSNMSRLHRRTQVYSSLLSDLSAVCRHFKVDDSAAIERIDIGGDYGPAVREYRKILKSVYPVDSYLIFFQMRSEVWDLPDHSDRAGFLLQLLRHVRQRPWDPVRLFLVRRAFLYLTRKSRSPGGHRPTI